MTPQDRIAEAQKQLRTAEKELVAVLAENKTRARAPVVRMLHEVRGMLLPARPYASQAGQDQIVDRILGGKTGGTFVDVGAYDGITGSNSLYFEKWRGWTGILVEPVPAQRETAISMRVAPCLPFAVAADNGSAPFISVSKGYTQMSGLADSYDDGMLERVRENPQHAEDMIEVETRTLSSILTDAGLNDPDFVSLDIEGGELSVLESFPFDKHKVLVWSIENNSGSAEIPKIMRANGYNLIEFCGPDEVYAHKSIDSKAS